MSQVFEKQLVPGGDALALEKYVSVVTSRDHAPQQLSSCGLDLLREAVQAGMQTLEEEQRSVWAARWQMCDVAIEGDDAAQQGIRFNLFQLLCTYDGSDARLNIGPKGFTGEKYGGAAYYDTEGYCFPLYLAVAGPEVARSLLMFRYNTLEKRGKMQRSWGSEGHFTPWSRSTVKSATTNGRSPSKNCTATQPSYMRYTAIHSIQAMRAI